MKADQIFVPGKCVLIANSIDEHFLPLYRWVFASRDVLGFMIPACPDSCLNESNFSPPGLGEFTAIGKTDQSRADGGRNGGLTLSRRSFRSVI